MKSSAKKLSDEELASKIERLKKEKEYIGLKKDTSGAGQIFVKDVLSSIGKKSLTQIGVGVTMFGAASVAKKHNAQKYVADVKNQW